MDIRQLNYFIQVADCGSYSLASQKLFVSQPALSKTIKNMEEELGITFFYTYQRRQHLTDAGQAFYDKASHLVK
jgi:DNA-binding transcriptional LysR family regulator